MNIYRYGLILSFVVLASSVSNRARAQAVASPATTSAAVNKTLALVPQNGVVCINLRMQQLMQDPALALAPWEIMSAAALDGLGMDVLKVDRVDMLVNWTEAGQPGLGFIVSTKEKVSLDQLNPDLFSGKITPSGGSREYRLFSSRELRGWGLCALSETQFALGYVEIVENLLNAKRGAGELAKQMTRLGESSHLSLIAVPAPVRSVLSEAISSAPEPLQADLNALAQKITLIAAKTQVGMSVQLPVVIETASDADAQAVEASWNRLVDFTLQQSKRSFFPQGGRSDSLTGQAMQSYLNRAAKELKQQLTPTRNGARLMLRLDDSLVSLLRGFSVYTSLAPMAPRFSGGGGAERKPALSLIGRTTNESLKTIALAFHNYHDTFKYFPAAGDTNPQKRPQLSWRVNILPFLGDPELTRLYQKFKMEEPWDSENNLPLVEAMPKIYRYSKAKCPAGHTVFQMPTGPGLMGELGLGTKMQLFTDGTSNTIMIALSTDAAAVPWTKPEDFNPVEHPDQLRNDGGGYTVAICDGSVTTLPATFTAEKLKALFTRAGGEVVERD